VSRTGDVEDAAVTLLPLEKRSSELGGGVVVTASTGPKNIRRLVQMQ
jgi:hypothetical protein